MAAGLSIRPAPSAGKTRAHWATLRRMMLTRQLGIFAAAGWLLTAVAAPAWSATQIEPNRWQDVEKIVAFGDVHGAHAELVAALTAAQLIDVDGQWTGGTTHLVSLGDLLDRGADSRRVMDLLMDLQPQAEAAGGRVHIVAGNHETMNLTGDLRYVASGEFAAFADPSTPEATGRPPGYRNHRLAFASTGQYGKWLLEVPLLVQINDTLFVHGGIPPALASESIAEVNARYRAELAELLDLGAQLIDAGLVDPHQDLLRQGDAAMERIEHPADPSLVAAARRFAEVADSDLFSWLSPNWYRGTALCSEPVEAAVLDAALARQGAQRVVMGHTPTSNRRVQQRFDGRAILADTGMLASYYRGQASLVTIVGDGLTVTYPAEGPEVVPPAPVPTIPGPATAVAALLASAQLPDPIADTPFQVEGVSVLFVPGSKRETANRLAAYELSKLLDWPLVPITVARDGGVLLALPTASLNEAQRIADGRGRPNHCAAGSIYQLMYAFDTLTFNQYRSADTMLYDPQTWQLWLTGHGRTFTRSRGVPRYLAEQPKVLPASVLQQLSELDEPTVMAALEPLIGAGNVRALLKRRDAMLDDWQAAPLQ